APIAPTAPIRQTRKTLLLGNAILDEKRDSDKLRCQLPHGKACRGKDSTADVANHPPGETLKL
ncbi:MAG: hypothetical protein U9N87_06040, partial [Planctomycetota bacterium]|nr:hypothetical protein [Planctomycetota bacterium]